jgi:Acetyltransferase (GNAT) domain
LSDPWLSADDIAAHLGLTKDTACGVPNHFAECGRKRPGVHRGLSETQFKFHPRRGGPPGEIVLGFRLRRSAWGQGYATEASRALIRKGFTELGGPTGRGRDHGREPGYPPGTGKGRLAPGPGLSSALALPARRPRARRRRIRRYQGRVGAAERHHGRSAPVSG